MASKDLTSVTKVVGRETLSADICGKVNSKRRFTKAWGASQQKNFLHIEEPSHLEKLFYIRTVWALSCQTALNGTLECN